MKGAVMNREYAEYAVKKAFELIAIDSPSGYTLEAMQWVKKQFNELGFKAELTNKGGVLIDFGGSDREYGIMMDAHGDTLGAMVAEIRPSGTLRLTNIGGFNANNAEAENVRVHTRSGKVYEGTIQLHNPSIHVNLEYSDTKRSFDTVEVYLDEDVHSVEDVKALGIRVGDYVCADPRSRVTESGYIKSRFLDDKLSVGLLMAYGKYIKDTGAELKHHLWGHVTVYEEVGHGASSTCPEGVLEVISVDMGCVGDGLECTERQVSI
ncbi:MAG: peptidase M42, partial [Firmicutes bacterium]|nr:peptidase M42 [Bacillota bacterium]